MKEIWGLEEKNIEGNRIRTRKLKDRQKNKETCLEENGVRECIHHQMHKVLFACWSIRSERWKEPWDWAPKSLITQNAHLWREMEEGVDVGAPERSEWRRKWDYDILYERRRKHNNRCFLFIFIFFTYMVFNPYFKSLFKTTVQTQTT